MYPQLSVGYLTSEISFSEDEPLATVEQIFEIVQNYETTFNPSYASGALGPKVMQAAAYRGITFWPYTLNKAEDFDKYFLYGTNGITTNYSYWVENYLKNVTTEQSHYDVQLGEEIELPVITTTYGRQQTNSQKGYMTVISGNAEGISYQRGKLTATEAGEYTVIFRCASSMQSGGVYYMYSQPVTISVTTEALQESVPGQDASTDQQPTEEDPLDPTCTEETKPAMTTVIWIAVPIAVIALSAGIIWLVIKRRL